MKKNYIAPKMLSVLLDEVEMLAGSTFEVDTTGNGGSVDIGGATQGPEGGDAGVKANDSWSEEW